MDTITIIGIFIMIIFVLLVSTPEKNTGFKDTVLEFRAGKLTEVQK